MMYILPFILSVIFYILCNYAFCKADIGNEKDVTYNLSTNRLFEEITHIHFWDVDEHIQKHILPCYKHYLLHSRISKYQNDEETRFPIFIIIVFFLSVLESYPFIVGGGFEPIWGFVISLMINILLYFLIVFLFNYTPVFNKLKLKNYSDVCDDYVAEYHYSYLIEIEESVMFRYFLRKIISAVAFIIFLLGIWSNDGY